MKGKIRFPSGNVESVNWSTTTKLTAHFTLGEFANQSAPEADKFIWTPEAQLHAIMMEELRMKFGKPIKVNSWYRTPQYNRKVGGISTSNHCRGTALDGNVGVITDAVWANFVNWWGGICDKYGVVGEILRYPNFIHFGSQITYSKKFYIEDKR